MPQYKKSHIYRAVEFAPIWVVLAIGRILPFWLRGKMFGLLGELIVMYLPKAKKRVHRGLITVFPGLSKKEINSITKKVGCNTALTLSELLMNDDYKKRKKLISADGEGFETLKEAKSNGQGAIIVSAHFGQWEAIRHHLAENNMETGAVYRKNNNPFYERLFLKSIKYGGLPIIARGGKGNINMIRHLKKGGFFALLVDQDSHSGKQIKFLGQDARTTTAPAEMALRYDLPLVPVFAVRQANGQNIKLEYEEAIIHTDAITMTNEINDRISARIQKNPEQWYWLHNRWNKE
ncbi:acyltransferase, HtrB family protein [alpha proteobacterium HTCC2255]|jgi:KDO2-lipid IV(A) lauroyltransferase|nr:acyltransferase, HtrB family protein [alpha proteobacterium HTCC2255] [Rhodobacterales bacterium HTCC2255]